MQNEPGEEAILDPDLPIVDAHHHLWENPQPRYLFDEFLADVRSGHNIVQTVFEECDSMYRAGGPEHLRAVGEAEFMAGIAAMSSSGKYGPTGLCAGYVGFADFRWGNLVAPALEALARASGGRLRGIRQPARDQDEELPGLPRHKYPAGLLGDSRFREGLRELVKRDLCYDSWQVHTQLRELADLVRVLPDLKVVICHLGGPIGTGSFADRRAEVFRDWGASMRELARGENVNVKLGGVGMPFMGFGFESRKDAASSEQLAEAWKPYIELCIEIFGPQRCMFESNFPVDRVSTSYRTMWNAFKRITQGCSDAEKAALYSGTARRVYRLGEAWAVPSAGVSDATLRSMR